MQNRLPLYLATAAASVMFAASVAALPLEKGALVEAAAPTAQVEFEVFLPLRNQAGLDSLLQAQQTPGAAQFHRWLTPAQFAAQFGPTPASIAKAQAAISAAGLQTIAVHTQSIRVSGTAAQAARLLQTNLNKVTSPSGAARFMAAGPIKLPSALSEQGAQVVAFSGLPPRKLSSVRTAKPLPENRYGPDGPYWFTDLKQAYDYPTYQPNYTTGISADGRGVNVAILMADLIFPNDVASFFTHEQWTAITHKPAPSVTTVTVDGGGVYNGYGSFEASLDVQQVLGGAPAANVTLVSIPDLNDSSIIDGYLYIVDSNTYDIVNSSFGECELLYTAAYNGGQDHSYYFDIYHRIFQQGNSEGITFVASSGDSGGLACPNIDYFTGGPNPKFIKGIWSPADDPDVTAVGGGNLVTSLSPTTWPTVSSYVSENGNGDPEVPQDPYGVGALLTNGYWGAVGGVSAYFAKPSYQNLVSSGNNNKRTVPDVGMQVGGCPLGLSVLPCGPNRSSVITAYAVGIGGGYYGVIGTSVSSPEFVGAIALYEQNAGRQGNLNPYLYNAGAAQTAAGGTAAPAAKQYYHRPTQGFDGVWYPGFPGVNYNFLFGNGTPDVRKLFSLTSLAPAGSPMTGSNP